MHSRPSDRRRRMPDGRACCDDVVVRRDGGGWKIEVADDWQRPMLGGSSSRGTGEPCLGDTGELSLRAYRGFAAELMTCILLSKYHNHIQLIQNPLARAAAKAPKFIYTNLLLFISLYTG